MVVDAGANTGVYALAVAATCPDASIVAFEPSPTVVEQCRTNVRANGFADRVDVRAVGLGSETGEATFYRSTYDELGSFNAGNAGAWEASVADTVSVPVATVDGLVADGEMPPPDHLKVDVEGFEYEVLAGARETLRRHRPVVYLEVHDVPDADAVVVQRRLLPPVLEFLGGVGEQLAPLHVQHHAHDSIDCTRCLRHDR